MTRKKKALIALGIFAAFEIFCQCNLFLKTVEYKIETEKLDAPVKIAFLSDLHNSLYGKGQSELIGRVEEFGADIVIFGGDLFDSCYDEKNSWLLVDALVNKYPCYYAVGNHEMRGKDCDIIKAAMAEKGVVVLEDDTRLIEINGQKLRICGTENVSDKNAVSQLDDNFSLLIHHFPGDFPEMSEKGFDLILSGHAHGGQWRIPYILNGFFAPDEGFFPKYAGGFYSENGTDMIVSRGLGKNLYSYIIPRIFNNPELLFITVN